MSCVCHEVWLLNISCMVILFLDFDLAVLSKKWLTFRPWIAQF